MNRLKNLMATLKSETSKTIVLDESEASDVTTSPASSSISLNQNIETALEVNPIQSSPKQSNLNIKTASHHSEPISKHSSSTSIQSQSSRSQRSKDGSNVQFVSGDATGYTTVTKTVNKTQISIHETIIGNSTSQTHQAFDQTIPFQHIENTSSNLDIKLDIKVNMHIFKQTAIYIGKVLKVIIYVPFLILLAMSQSYQLIPRCILHLISYFIIDPKDNYEKPSILLNDENWEKESDGSKNTLTSNEAREEVSSVTGNESESAIDIKPIWPTTTGSHYELRHRKSSIIKLGRH